MTSRWEIFPDDLDATADFYIRVLGFEIVGREARTEGYLDLRRDDVRIGASLRSRPLDTGPRLPPMGVELVLEVDDVREERQRVLAAGWPLAEDLIERPWNMIDFRVVDPSGYYVRITNRG